MQRETQMMGPFNGPRTCPHGHGPMVLAEGLFGFPQMQLQPPNALAGLLSPQHATQQPGRLTSTGKVFTVRVFACQTCGTLELVDSDKV